MIYSTEEMILCGYENEGFSFSEESPEHPWQNDGHAPSDDTHESPFETVLRKIFDRSC